MAATQYLLTANGSTASFSVNGSGCISVRGTFSGGSIVIEGRLGRNGDGNLSVLADFAPAQGSESYTDDFFTSVSGGKNKEYRLTLTGATTPSITIDIEDNR